MRVAVFGSPQFAIPTLEAVYKQHELVLVVSQPDKPVGRGMKLRSPPLALRAKKLGLRLEQPSKLKTNEGIHERLKELKIDVAITAAFGKILPQSLLDIPHHGFLNVHASLLPKYRGAAPIQWALINGERETGISIMQTEAGLDTGPVRHVKKVTIPDDATATDLFTHLADVGAQALIEALELLDEGTLPSVAQDDSKATLAPLLKKEDGLIRWQSAKSIYNRYRGVIAWPKTYTIFRDQPLKVHALSVVEAKAKAGLIFAIEQDGVYVGAGEDAIRLELVQMPNKTKMPAYDWANGYGLKLGDKLG